MNNRQEPYRGETQYRRVPQYDRRRDYDREREMDRGDYETQGDSDWRDEGYGRREFENRENWDRDYRTESDRQFGRDYSTRENYRSREDDLSGRPDRERRFQSRWFDGANGRSNMHHGFGQDDNEWQGYVQRDRNAGMNVGRTGDYYPRNGGAEQPRNELGQFTATRGQFLGRGPKGYRRSDDRITEDICEALSQDPELDASEIEVKVENCDVTLTGSVTERQFKRMAEDIAERCSGVRDVHNQIRVQRQDNQETMRTSR